MSNFNNSPTSANSVIKSTEDVLLGLSLKQFVFQDADRGDSLRDVVITGLPKHGGLLLDGVPLAEDQRFSAVDLVEKKVTYRPIPDFNGIDALEFRVSDGKSDSEQKYILSFEVAPVNDAPVISAGVSKSQQATEGVSYSYEVPANAFRDVDGDGVLLYKASLSNGKALPKWLKFDAASRLLSGTPNDEDSGIVLGVKIMAIDTGKASVADTFDLQVIGVNQSPKAREIMKPASATEGKAFSYSLPKGTFTDNDKGDVLEYAIENIPTWLSIDKSTGKISGKPDYVAADNGSVSLKITAADRSGLKAESSLVVNIANVSALKGTALNDKLIAGKGEDRIAGGKGADILTGGADSDVFIFASGDSGQHAGFDVITDFEKRGVHTGDLIDYKAALVIGGSSLSATEAQASINSVTGVASFFAGSGQTMLDALSDIATRFSAEKDAVGEFAFFQLAQSGSHFLFISDGKPGLSAADVVIELIGVNSISGLDLTAGNLAITS